MNNYRLSDLAKSDLKAIYQYGVSQHGVIQADKYFLKLFDQFEKIAIDPLLYPRVDHIRKGYHRCPCGEESIYYQIKKDTVEIMSIIRSQNADQWLK